MNCQDLETVTSELARRGMMDATLRENALSHAASCACCARRLADERALTAGLELVAAAGEEAPASVETSLLVAFREQHSTGHVRPLVSRWLYVAAGIAAVAAMVMLLSLTLSRSPQQPVQQKSGGPKTEDKADPNEVRLSPPQQPPVRANAGKKLVSDRAGNRTRSRSAPRPKNRPDGVADSRNDSEIATDFFPLVNRESFSQLDSGQVVRVELPRSALMSFGLPMNMERAHERIKADVVVGNDGLARAIRFVR